MRQSRNTIQRGLVLEAVRHMHNHPTAEEIYTHVANEYPSISKGTVYRNLALLAQQGEIRRVTGLNAADRFDFQLHDHTHFHCLGCDAVLDMELPADPQLINQVQNAQGFDIQTCNIVFSGLCPLCKPNAGKPA